MSPTCHQNDTMVPKCFQNALRMRLNWLHKGSSRCQSCLHVYEWVSHARASRSLQAQVYENMHFWVSFSRTFWKPFLGPIWDQFGALFVVYFDVFFDDNFDADFGPYFGAILEPFLTLSVILSGLYGHLKTMQKQRCFTCFVAIPAFKRYSKLHQKPYKKVSYFEA